MNQFLLSFLELFKTWDRGELANFPDPTPPSDLGAALTQPEIDFVKKLKKEMEQRFATNICSAEKTGSSISNAAHANFTASWTNPSGYTGTAVTYRVQGSTVWLVPNAPGNATGVFNSGGTTFSFTTGFTAGTIYEVLLRNSCPNGVLSTGLTLSATAT